MSCCKPCEVRAATRGQAAALSRFASGMGMVVSVRAPQMAGFLEDAVFEQGAENTAMHLADQGQPSKSGEFPKPGTTPGAVPVVASAWHFDTHPATYEAQQGDTFTGLAKTYLPSSPPGVRWTEIWNLNRDTHPNPDKIGVGDILNMPDDATGVAKQAIGEHGTKPSEKEGSFLRALFIGAAIAIAGTGVAYGANYLAKRSKRRRGAPQLRAA